MSKHKAINSRYNRSMLKRDPDFALVSSIEIFDHESQTATKGVIFNKRTVRPRAEVTQSANASEALLVSLNQVGRVDLALIARLARIDQDQAAAELGGAGKIYLDPVTQEWQSAAVYLCGDIRSKLADAEFAAKGIRSSSAISLRCTPPCRRGFLTRTSISSWARPTSKPTTSRLSLTI